MKPFLLLAGLLLAASPATAQTAALPALAALPAAAPAVAPAAPDTLAAIHRLFAARRKRQGYAAGITIVAAVGTLVALVSNRPPRPSGSNGFGVIATNDLDLLVYAVLTLPAIPLVAIGFGGWGRKYEQRVIATWQQRHQLPRSVQRQLKPVYFQ